MRTELHMWICFDSSKHMCFLRLPEYSLTNALLFILYIPIIEARWSYKCVLFKIYSTDSATFTAICFVLRDWIVFLQIGIFKYNIIQSIQFHTTVCVFFY